MAFWNKKKPAKSRLDLVPGTVVRTEDGWFYIQTALRVHIPTYTILDSWKFPRVLKASEESLKHLPKVGKLGFRDGTFVTDGSGLYIISQRKRIPLNKEQIEDHGLSYRDITYACPEELAVHKEVKL